MLSLPIDIQVLVLPLLSSTSLIAISQTNRYFRDLVQPDKRQFVNRLLELECLPEYGGEVTINENAKIIVPSESVSYACTRCLKIIPHTRFDNHAILRLRFRKPPPKSRAARKLCGWVSGDAKARGLKRQDDLKNDTLENWMRQIDPSCNLAEWTSLYHIGSCRNRRLCNECKFATGFWSRNVGVRGGWRGKQRNSNVGTAQVPVVKGRQRRCHDSTERYFWGLFPIAADSHYPWRWKIYREENCDWWTLWWIRCPGCAVWQERAAFRKGSGYGVKATPADPDMFRQSGWDGPHFENWRCHQCFAVAFGEKELERELLAFWNEKVGYELSQFRSLLPSSFYVVDGIEQQTGKKYSWEQIVKMDSVSSQLLRKVPSGRELARADDEQRRHYYKILKRWFDTLDTPEQVLGGLMDRSWFRQWIVGYDILEKRIEELETCTKILEADPNTLVSFAFSGKGTLM
ncbi:hypothetical protein DL98DRAFT_572635 [Cadophora sp. DSE1049]|nr:hypothetical protein DL98DRAFT_572635 [Cadophora sp. DSE1049]